MTGKRAGAVRLVRVWLVSSLLWLGVPAVRADEAQLVAYVEELLTAGVEPGAAHDSIAALGDAGEHALREVFSDDTAPRHARLRALSVLASFETESTARYFEALVRAAQAPDTRFGNLHPARSPLVLRRALEGLLPTGRLLAPRLDSSAVTWCLGHDDAHVRRVASELLATLDGDSKIDGALDKQLVRERSRMVRGSMMRALTSRFARSTSPR